MITVLRAERTKFATVRALPVLAGSAVLASVVMSVLVMVSLPLTVGTPIATTPPSDVLEAALLGIDVAAIVLMVLGASAAGSEYATGLAQPTFVLTPRRSRVVLAKAVVVGVVATGVAALAAVLAVVVGQLALVMSGIEPAPVDWRLVVGSTTAPVFYALVGLFGAFVTRSTGAGAVVALVVFLLPLIQYIPGLDVLAFLPPQAAVHGLSGVSDPGAAEYLAAGPAALSLVGWTMVIGAIALHRVQARDV